MTLLLCPVLSVYEKYALHMSITWWNTRYGDAIGRETSSRHIFLNLFVYISIVKQVLWLKAATEPVWHVPDAVCTVLDSWWWTERPSETCRVLFQNKINLRYCASGWFSVEIYYDARSYKRQIYLYIFYYSRLQNVLLSIPVCDEGAFCRQKYYTCTEIVFH